METHRVVARCPQLEANLMNTLATRRSSTQLALPGTASRATWSRFGAMFAMLLALFILAVSTQAADVMQLAPSYKAVGKNGDGSGYTGTVTIKIISDTTFSIEWKIGGSVTKGFGMRMNDTLSATYMLDGQPGLIIYKAQGDGSLAGIWAIKGQSGNGSETLTPR